MPQRTAQIIAQKHYGNRIRVRVCGICIENNRVLMIAHRAVLGENTFWSPPGGGVEYYESAEDALRREFLEETGLEVAVEKFIVMNEFIQLPLHAIELFFLVKKIGGTLILGHDPEMSSDEQLIEKIEWLSFDEIKRLNLGEKHQFWQKIENFEEVTLKTDGSLIGLCGI